jgi:hypothetical protein
VSSGVHAHAGATREALPHAREPHFLGKAAIFYQGSAIEETGSPNEHQVGGRAVYAPWLGLAPGMWWSTVWRCLRQAKRRALLDLLLNMLATAVHLTTISRRSHINGPGCRAEDAVNQWIQENLEGGKVAKQQFVGGSGWSSACEYVTHLRHISKSGRTRHQSVPGHGTPPPPVPLSDRLPAFLYRHLSDDWGPKVLRQTCYGPR